MENGISSALKRLQLYVEKENYKGFDPYDGLLSPLFKLPLLRSNKTIRFTFQQFIKRFPLNLRPLLGIRKGENPVTIGLCIQAYSYLSEVYPDQKDQFLSNIDALILKLEQLSCKSYSSYCWGYDFDWEARYFSVRAYQPTVVATGIITNALYECWKITKNQTCAKMITSSSTFVLKDLNRTGDEELFCFSYSPFDRQKVLNASMKGARLLAQAYLISKDENLKKPILAASRYVLNQQHANGAFEYSDQRQKIDHYHTAYILDCLDEIQQCLGTNLFEAEIKKGLDFYIDSFFTESGKVKFYNDSIYPIDCTAAGQALLTLSRFDKIDLGEKVALYTLSEMQHKNGFFYFRKYKFTTNKTSFMRWSNAWMFVGLSAYLKHKAVSI